MAATSFVFAATRSGSTQCLTKLFWQITDGLVGPDWTLLSIDPCFASARNAILRELTQIGLTE